jgi:hypothetical protein
MIDLTSPGLRNATSRSRKRLVAEVVELEIGLTISKNESAGQQVNAT